MKLAVVTGVLLAVVTIIYAQSGTTQNKSPDVKNLRVVNLTSNYVKLVWDLPSDPNVVAYELRYFTEDNSVNSTGKTSKEYYEVSNLTLGVKYGFQVRAESMNGWGNYTKTLFLYQEES
jgi:hypothetical protein